MPMKRAFALPRMGLRARLFLYSNAIIAVTMGLVTALVVVYDQRQQYHAVEARGRSVAAALAVPITDTLMKVDLGLTEDAGLADDYISEIVASNHDAMRYVIVTDARGIVTHSNRASMLGHRFERAAVGSQIRKYQDVEQRVEKGERMLEVREPLQMSGRLWGSLAVGFSLYPTERHVEATLSRLVVVVLLVMVANSVLTAFSMESILGPVLSLHQVMQKAGRGDLTVRAETRRRDEIGELGEAFNRMMVELEEGRERDKAHHSQLAHTEKMAAVGTLATGVAHEVNNPLAGILTCIENMRANPDDAEMRDRYLLLIQDGIKRIERTVASLLDFSRQRAVSPAPMLISASLRSVLQLASYKIRHGHVHVQLDLDPSERPVIVDRFQIEQLFLNLVLNALQAMPQGGQLGLRTARQADWLVVEVRDTGVGMSKEIRDRIFDPFFTTRDVGEGTGLGLAVSDSIVAAHGGRLEVETREGEGSVFRVLLPRGAESGEEA